ncbi:RNA polymerase factor sigma-54 [Acidaminococcus timonensis]|uniref:RNA polymerase factor sigma-54 n=2 Tax=Acidaminococcus TaxID=904 RepID=UPI0025DFE843|nr:RNA polymerase factor sigma-54 [Acidaminococcus timonensis]
MPTTRLTLAPQQRQQLNLHLVQQMKLLQLNSLELDQYVQEAVEANPLLEFARGSGSDGWQETDGREYARSHGTRSRDDEPAPDPMANAARQEETLQQVLQEQLGCQKLSPEERQLARYIIGTLDGNGWWRENVDDTAKAFGVEPKLVEAALHRVQQLEPAGVGARSLAQCLELQLPPEAPELVRQIIREGLELLGQNQIPALAKKFRTTKQAVLAAKDIICSLDPKPGARYASSGPVAYQREDVRVDAGENGLTLTVYDTWGGKFVLNQEYLDWGKEQGNAQVKAYLKEQLGKARQLQQLLKARQQTLLQVFQALVTHQESFFRLGPGHKQPLKLADLAEETGLAISTVSRALQHKAIGCKWGCFAAGSFLVGEAASRAAGTVTEERLQQLIHQVIDAEDKHHPLSDQAICETLERQGVHTARRTVNKYRVKLGIPGKSGRKVWE